MKNFDYEKFITELIEEFKESLNIEEVKEPLTIEEVKEILELGESYSRDSPMSTGKSLVLNHIAFKGEKDSGEIINYNQSLKKGINIWVADNFKGKSSILKIIKYVLTGNNSLKTSDIKQWIKEILLTFSIGNKDYTIYLDSRGNRLKSQFFNIKLSTWGELSTTNKEPIFQTSTEIEYTEKIQKFFFNQFSYYSLKWTQKSPAKDSNELIEVDASWKTYFKSIYLESKDSYELIFGEQGKKIFQMLLSLELTYPINQLTIKRDFLKDKKGKEKFLLEENEKAQTSNKKELTQKLSDINIKLQELNKKKPNEGSINISLLNERYKLSKKEYEDELNNHHLFDTKIKELREKRKTIDTRRNAIHEDASKAKREIEKNQKRLLELQEYLEIGIFFSNLDIKHCPSCNHQITEHKKKEKLAEHKCSLCDESVLENENDLDAEDYKEKILGLEINKNDIEKLISEWGKESENLRIQSENIYNELIITEQKKAALKDVEALFSSINDIENKIKAELEKSPLDNKEKEELIRNQAVLEFQIKELEKIKPQAKSGNYDKKISLLNAAIDKLILMRYEIGKNVLERLEQIMLNEIQAFGLTSITEVSISEKFDVLYKQNGVFIKFNDVTEGEQLRTKIAFYLSLIQLDIEFSRGRHTRFLMIDSPGKEEGDSKYLEGLSAVLKNIENRFGTELQILIGTAERRFENIVKNQYITPRGTYIF